MTSLGSERPSYRVARFVYPIAVYGFAAAALLNAVSWLPVDVSNLTPVWVALFIGIFPVWIPVVIILACETNGY